MADPHVPTNSPLDADDPRISEWIDGRLAPAEAMAVERAVQASSELASLVEDLRAIRGAMRTEVMGVLKIDLGDRVMAAIAVADGSGQHIPAAPAVTISHTHQRRHLPWLGLAGALAAGLLVTVVVNRPRDNGRDVALAPREDESLARGGLYEARRASREVPKAEKYFADRDAEDRLEVAATAKQVGAERFRAGQPEQTLEEQALVDAAPITAMAAEPSEPPPSVAAESFDRLSGRRQSSGVESAKALASGGGSPAPRDGGVLDVVVPSPAAPRFSNPAPAQDLKALAATPGTPPEGATAAAPAGPESRPSSKRAKLELAGVLVIAVTSKSERRALDRLVAASGLEATPAKDHLELVGTAAAVDAFLGELTRVGLVSAVPSRRVAEAGKLKGAEKRGDEQTSLILRVVERRAKQPPASQAGEAKEQP